MLEKITINREGNYRETLILYLADPALFLDPDYTFKNLRAGAL